jgi:hypothetical protein
MHRAPASWSSSYSATSIALELNEEAATVAIGARVFELDAVYGATRTQVRVSQNLRRNLCASVSIFGVLRKQKRERWFVFK